MSSAEETASLVLAPTVSQRLREVRLEVRLLRTERDELFELMRAYVESQTARENADTFNAMAARVDSASKKAKKAPR